MGGKIGIKYADMFPKNLDKLVVVDITNKEYSSKRFNHIFLAINALNKIKINSRSHADLISRKFIPIRNW